MGQMYFIGVDLSKSKVDVFVVDASFKKVLHREVVNNPTKLKGFFGSFRKQQGASVDDLLVCCENTGIYGRHLERVCSALGIPLWVENAAIIKKTTAHLRGKSDLLDSQRIAEYALRNADHKRLWVPEDDTLKRMRDLRHARGSLIGSINRLKQQMNESRSFDPGLHAVLKKGYTRSIKAMEADLARIEKEIKGLVDANEDIRRNVDLASSVVGVGPQLAMQVVVTTSNFQKFESPKQLACHAGVVPFPNESGTVARRPRVSKQADPRLKTLLHLAALAAIRHNPELKEYYERKVAEGKNKMMVLNAVRNKLIHIIYAVVRRGTPYTKESPYANDLLKNTLAAA